MQRHFFAIATATAAITLGAFSFSPSQSDAQMLSEGTAPVVLAQATGSTAAAKSGQFVTAEHETQGSARIVTENGQRYLEFDSAFRSDNRPDLFVLLHRQGRPTRYQGGDFVRLGRLQSTKGTQRYAIPDNVSLSEFNSAVIWCRAFNATFGFAPLW